MLVCVCMYVWHAQAVQRMNANRPVAREYTSWVQRQRQGAGRNSKPSGVKPSLHWMDYVLPTAAPQDPMRHLGKDAAPYAHYVDVDRKFNDAFLRHRDAQAAMAERVKQLQGQHGDDAPTDEVSKVTFRRTVRDMGNTAPPSGGRDAVLDADANSELESSISARVDRVRQEADAIAFAVKEGVKEGVREVEKGMAGQEEKMGEGMRREVDQMVTSAVEPWVKQADEERSVVVEQGKLIADMRGRIAKMEAHAPSAAGPAAAPSADYVTEAVSAAVKAAVSAATATSASPSSAAPPAVSFSLPGQVSLPGGAYTFSLGSPGAAAPSSFIQPVQYADTSPPLTAEPPVASASGDDDDLLDTMRDLDNGVDAAKVKEAADQLMRRLVAQGAPAPAGGAQEEDSGVLDTRTGTSSGVDMDAVRRAADELQRRLIARLAGGDAAGDSDVLDTRTDTSAGVDASAVGAAAAALEKRMVGRQGPSDVLDSVVGTSAGVDRDAVVSAADALQRSLIAKGSGAPPDVLDSVVGTSAGVDSAGVDAAADALQRNIITGESAARASGGKGRGDDVLNSVMDLDNGVDVQAVKEAAMRLQREVASRLDHSGKGVA